jgi:hypothetical protein
MFMLNNAHVLCGTRDIRGLVHDVFRHDFRHGPSQTLATRGALSAGIGSGAPLARIVAECAVCGHGSNHVTALAYSVNRDNTGDWRCGDFGDRRGVMAGAERAATKSRRGMAATGHTGFLKTKKSARSSQKQ